MRHGDEGVQALEWAMGRLTGSETVRAALEAAHGAPVAQESVWDYVWNDPAPADVQEPFIVLSAAEPLDHRAIGPQHRTFSSVPLSVKVVDKARSYDRAAPIARAIYSELEGRTAEPVSDGGSTLSCRRDSGIQYPEDAEGVQYRHLGHLFTVEVN